MKNLKQSKGCNNWRRNGGKFHRLYPSLKSNIQDINHHDVNKDKAEGML